MNKPSNSIKYSFTIALLLFGVVLNAQQQERALFPDSSQIMKDLFLLSADSMMGRQSGTKGNEMARDYIINKLQKEGVPAFVPGYKQEFEYRSGQQTEALTSGINILAYIEGFSRKETIVISAHYDHVGANDSLDVFNGADDNASGTAALLSLAKYFTVHQPENSFIFAFFDAEEDGLQGAKHFIKSLVVDSALLKLNVNLDMVGRGDKNEIYAVGTYFHPELKPLIEEAAKEKHIKVLFGRDEPKKKPNWVGSSDHAPFHKAGIPFVYFGVDDHADYHKPSDTADKISPQFYLEAVRMIKESLLHFDANLRDIDATR